MFPVSLEKIGRSYQCQAKTGWTCHSPYYSPDTKVILGIDIARLPLQTVLFVTPGTGDQLEEKAGKTGWGRGGDGRHISSGIRRARVQVLAPSPPSLQLPEQFPESHHIHGCF